MTTRDQLDRARAAAVAAYGILDEPPRRELVALVDLAARAVGVDYAMVNLFTEDTQHTVASAGFGVDPPALTMSRDEAMCRTTLETEQPVLVKDARSDPRFATNPYVEGGFIRFFGSHPLRTPAGLVIGTLCVYQDEARPVTMEAAENLELLASRVVDVLELELASRRLSDVNDRLTRANERLAHFAGQVSHDLKTPLTSVSMSLELLEGELSDRPDLEILVARALRGTGRMTELINELLVFAATGQDPEESDVDLAEELGFALDDLTGVLQADQVTVGVLPVVCGDPTQLRSVLMNLLVNAAKFNRAGEPPQIEVVAISDGVQHRIEVRDRGVGVPEDQRESIFLPLVRLHESVPGSGIGLATCRRIVEAHGGRMGVDARAGGGSIFWFVLPAPGHR